MPCWKEMLPFHSCTSDTVYLFCQVVIFVAIYRAGQVCSVLVGEVCATVLLVTAASPRRASEPTTSSLPHSTPSPSLALRDANVSTSCLTGASVCQHRLGSSVWTAVSQQQRQQQHRTFNRVDIWKPCGFSVSPPGQMIFRWLFITTWSHTHTRTHAQLLVRAALGCWWGAGSSSGGNVGEQH